MPLGMLFRKAVLWHEGEAHVFGNMQEMDTPGENMKWNFRAKGRGGVRIEARVDGSGAGMHRLPYVKTDCTGTFEVRNNSGAGAFLALAFGGGEMETLRTTGGAVLEVVG
jgi:hypothetical protein